MFRTFCTDLRHQKAFLFSFEYYTIIGEDCKPMHWQRSDKGIGPGETQMPLSRCSAIVALALNDDKPRQIRIRHQGAQTSYGWVQDIWSPWQVSYITGRLWLCLIPLRSCSFSASLIGRPLKTYSNPRRNRRWLVQDLSGWVRRLEMGRRTPDRKRWCPDYYDSAVHRPRPVSASRRAHRVARGVQLRWCPALYGVCADQCHGWECEQDAEQYG